MQGYYRHSGAFNPIAALTGFAAATAVAIALGPIYAWVDIVDPIVQINVLLAMAYGAGVGWVAAFTLRKTGGRNTIIAVATSVAAIAIGYHFCWASWLAQIISRTDLEMKPSMFDIALHPRDMWHLISVVNATGTWAMDAGEEPVKGIALTIAWIGEAGLVVGGCIAVPWVMIGRGVFCEACGTWCVQQPGVRVAAWKPKTELREKLEAHDLSPLMAAPLREPKCLSVSLYVCASPTCGQTNALSVFEVTVRGKKATQKVLLRNLLVTRAEVDALRARTFTANVSLPLPPPAGIAPG